MTHLVLLPLREGQVEDLLEVLCLHFAIRILLCQLGEVSGTEYNIIKQEEVCTHDKHDKLKELFPRHERIHDMEKRNCEKFVVKKAMTERYRKSAVLSMQRLLNQSEKEKSKIFKRINDIVPVNYDFV